MALVADVMLASATWASCLAVLVIVSTIALAAAMVCLITASAGPDPAGADLAAFSVIWTISSGGSAPSAVL
ncbi:MAG: hypothetical protein A3G24_06515 [Betaproteobacteria bacterium RIFCSPLOWO2_12_FULL_62_13]|nr:MAG: hypothetical protein A3G24_06515 [Betaproteobacteria bacterium RIFCSPLOWO2_12_FULL_62_13]